MKLITKICYILSLILVIVFISLIILSYIKHKKLRLNPLVMVSPFSSVVKIFSIRLLVPAFILSSIGFIINRNNFTI